MITEDQLEVGDFVKISTNKDGKKVLKRATMGSIDFIGVVVQTEKDMIDECIEMLDPEKPLDCFELDGIKVLMKGEGFFAESYQLKTTHPKSIVKITNLG